MQKADTLKVRLLHYMLHVAVIICSNRCFTNGLHPFTITQQQNTRTPLLQLLESIIIQNGHPPPITEKEEPFQVTSLTLSKTTYYTFLN